MIVFATPEFKKEYDKIIKNNSYKDFTQDIINSYFGKEFDVCLSGTRLNGNSINPFIKKRINGSGGGRLYLLAVISKESIYFTFLSPKSGSYGSDNLTDEKIAELLETVYACIKKSDLFTITASENNRDLIFTPIIDEENVFKKFITEEIRYYYEYELEYSWCQTADNNPCIQIGELLSKAGVTLKDVYPKKDFTSNVYYKEESISNTSTFIVENRMINEDAFSQINIDHCITSLQNNLYKIEHEWEDEIFNKKYFVLEYKESN